MATATGKYLGNLRCEWKHEASGATIITDAPVDNHGKGEGFSPTDICAASLGACAMTIMGIYAQSRDIDLSGATFEVEKVMSKEPRRIGEIKVIFRIPDRDFDDKTKISLERAANTCPIHQSLHPDVKQSLVFEWVK